MPCLSYLLFLKELGILILVRGSDELGETRLLLRELLVIRRFLLHEALNRSSRDCELTWWRHF